MTTLHATTMHHVSTKPCLPAGSGAVLARCSVHARLLVLHIGAQRPQKQVRAFISCLTCPRWISLRGAYTHNMEDDSRLCDFGLPFAGLPAHAHGHGRKGNLHSLGGPCVARSNPLEANLNRYACSSQRFLPQYCRAAPDTRST